MSICIVCGKSAGLLYSLHKDCYQRYQDLLNSLPAALIEGLPKQSVESLLTQIDTAFAGQCWRERCRQDLVGRVLHAVGTALFQNRDDQSGQCQKLAELFRSCDIDLQQAGLVGMMQRLESWPAVEALLRNDDLSFDEDLQAKFPYPLEPEERVVWQFQRIKAGVRIPTAHNIPTSSLGRLLDILTSKRHPQPIETQWIGDGEIWLTTRRMECKTGDQRETIWLHRILSITPLKEGVRLQQLDADSVAKDYLCGDGRLMHTLLQRVLRMTSAR